MNLKYINLIILFLYAITITGCSPVPINNVIEEPIYSLAGNPLTKDQVGPAIKRAALLSGWKVKTIKSGHMVATLNIKQHMAKVDIKYTEKDFSITFKDSAGLERNGELIHKKYNSWVKRLQRNISTQLKVVE